MQARERRAVPAIRFHPIPAAFRHHRRAHDDAPLAAFRQVSIDPEAAGSGFVHEVQHAVRRAERPNHSVERLEVARDDAVVANLAPAGTLRHGDVDRFLVDIEPYKHATVPHDLPPRLSRVVAVRRTTSSAMCEDGRSMLRWRDLSVLIASPAAEQALPMSRARAGGGRRSTPRRSRDNHSV
jgi:hypothetical protein